MTDDIVTRLRDIAVMTDDHQHETLAWQAADEIELLRKEVSKWKEVSKRFYEGHKNISERKDWKMMRAAIKAFNSAMSGDQIQTWVCENPISNRKKKPNA